MRKAVTKKDMCSAPSEHSMHKSQAQVITYLPVLTPWDRNPCSFHGTGTGPAIATETSAHSQE